MKLCGIVCLIALGFGLSFVEADDPAPKAEKKQEVVKATFLITGLHCPPCTQTVEDSLRKMNGVKSAKVDWNSKNAVIEFDELLVPTQRLSKLIAETSHMMGGDMQYAGWLALKVADMKDKDDATWNRLKETLSKQSGVKQVSVYKAQSGVGVRFDAKGELTSKKLIAALSEAGFKASHY